MALDVIDDAIATLDALKARDEDREDDDPAEGTSLERFHRGFNRCGADDEEDSNGSGDEDSGISDEDGMQDQLVAWSHCPALAFSNGGYVG